MNKSAVIAAVIILGAGGVAIWMKGDSSSSSAPKLPVQSAMDFTKDVISKKKEDDQKAVVEQAQSEGSHPEPSKTGPWPVAKTGELTYHFGRMEVGAEDGRHSFTIRNEGEAELQLQTGKATCQCTSFSLTKNKLAPGEETQLVVVWQLKTKNEMFRHGGPVYTNDPENPTLDFSVEGIVDAPFEILPDSEWNIGNVFPDKPARMQATVASKVHPQFHIEMLEASSEFVKFEIVPLTEIVKVRDSWSSGYTVNVEVSNEIPPGPFECTVKLKFDLKEHVSEITLRGRKQGNIRFLPTPGTTFDPTTMVLKMGTFQAQTGNSKKIMLVVNQEGMTEPLKITSQKVVPAFLNVSLEPAGEAVGNSRRYFLTVEYPPGRPRASFGPKSPARVTLETNHPKGEGIGFEIYLATN